MPLPRAARRSAGPAAATRSASAAPWRTACCRCWWARWRCSGRWRSPGRGAPLRWRRGVWVARLVALARSLQAVAFAALLLVAGIAACVVAVAVRAGIAARRQAIAVLHELGATDGDIAGRFAARAALLTGLGALGGT